MTTHTTKHTPGPWTVDANNDVKSGQGDICWLPTNERRKANAALIAAAPAMLEALQYVRQFYQDNFDIMPVAFQTVDTICEQAIAAAEGRS